MNNKDKVFNLFYLVKSKLSKMGKLKEVEELKEKIFNCNENDYEKIIKIIKKYVDINDETLNFK